MVDAITLEKMTVEEKMQVIEEIWNDLCRRSDQVPSPAWHADVLSERSKSFNDGQAEFDDWDKAKKRIRNAVQ